MFWNISLYDAHYFEAMFGDFVFPDFTKPEWQSVARLQNYFLKWFNQERSKSVLTFPVVTAAMLTDGTRTLDILRGVDLAVNRGEVLAITGPSGVGKSTLLHLMGTLDVPTAGEVLFHGNSVWKAGRAEVNRIRNREIGFVFQFYHLLPEFTALENVMMPALCKGESQAKCLARAEALIARVGLSDRATHKPGQLSGGEQQRVAIARALVTDPAILLADEFHPVRQPPKAAESFDRARRQRQFSPRDVSTEPTHQ